MPILVKMLDPSRLRPVLTAAATCAALGSVFTVVIVAIDAAGRHSSSSGRLGFTILPS